MDTDTTDSMIYPERPSDDEAMAAHAEELEQQRVQEEVVKARHIGALKGVVDRYEVVLPIILDEMAETATSYDRHDYRGMLARVLAEKHDECRRALAELRDLGDDYYFSPRLFKNLEGKGGHHGCDTRLRYQGGGRYLCVGAAR